ncbi:MraY family glycosyltransferase [Eudoraea adriatica]|uniref:MraY family glycosyltransferase n=1 Tax=Eudoraea adriatica TaxID=446681 RepID=UPI00039F8B3C|nr:MraY family glycosyltransferase [Eudoraea adriatica]
MTYFYDFMRNPYILAFLGGLLAFALANRIIPVIIYTVRTKNLMDEPGDRSVHSTKTPTLGGVGMFAAFAVSIILFGILARLERPDLVKLLSVVLATIILIFLGIKDDLIALAARKKFLGQLISVCIVIILTDVRITSFEGLLGIGELPYLVSVLFTVFVFILVINAFNLIDGIDGLAGAIGIIASFSFGLFFLLNKDTLMVLVSFSLIGAIGAFLRYNLSGTRKLFMGDSGSMVIGYLLAYQGIRFLEVNLSEASAFTIENGPVLLLAVLSFPLLDTLRIFIIRARERRSPFDADRNHIHHRLLERGLSHKQATILLTIVNILVIELAVLLKDFEINIQLVAITLLGSLLYTLLFSFNRLREKAIKFDDLRSVKKQGRVIRMGIQDSFVSQRIVSSPVNNGVSEKTGVNSSDATIKEKEWPLGEKRIQELEKSKKQNLSTKKRREKFKSAKAK